jgi:glycosyltransferase involved in cell wall biosynthesis
MLSVIIPSYKDQYLNQTVNSILENAGVEVEVIVVLDGYWRDDIINDPRVKYVHLGRNRGMRGAINAGVCIAQGEYLMRADEHCLFAKDFAKIVLETIQPNWIVCMKRFYLDPVKWEVMNLPAVEFEKLCIQDNKKFAGFRWTERDIELKDTMIAETMAMQGSCWIMPHQWWKDVIGELQNEGYHSHYQDSHEMVFKTWKAGGKLMLNKNTWYAHRHRDFPRTHAHGSPENPMKSIESWTYSLNLWKDYYTQEIVPKWGI